MLLKTTQNKPFQPVTCTVKGFTIIIYDHSDHGHHYKAIITIVSYAPNFALALACVINYDCK